MSSKELVNQALSHQKISKIPVDFGSTTVTGMHCKVVEGLRNYYGLTSKPVKVIEPYQMLGEIDEELQQIIGIDAVSIFGPKDLFGINQENYKEAVTPWGQIILIPMDYDFTPDSKNDVYVFPEGDRNCSPSGIMPDNCYFFNAIERQLPIDENTLIPDDNNEEYGLLSEADLQHFEKEALKASQKGKCVVASFGGTALGDVALIPGMSLKHPKGIRSVAEWYMATITQQDLIHQMFDKQIDIAISNYEKLWKRIGDNVDVIYLCGADFGTQNSQFCSVETFRSLWLPHYKRMTDWIHHHTSWKVFKHSCGSIVPLLPAMIEAGFDIINPVQINAKGMDPIFLKEEFGKDITFWGGGVDTQIILPSAPANKVYDHVLRQCEIMSKDGGFVFSSIHNIQANVPIENIVAMINAVHDFNR